MSTAGGISSRRYSKVKKKNRDIKKTITLSRVVLNKKIPNNIIGTKAIWL
jgi:hypothetical protein